MTDLNLDPTTPTPRRSPAAHPAGVSERPLVRPGRIWLLVLGLTIAAALAGWIWMGATKVTPENEGGDAAFQKQHTLPEMIADFFRGKP